MARDFALVSLTKVFPSLMHRVNNWAFRSSFMSWSCLFSWNQIYQIMLRKSTNFSPTCPMTAWTWKKGKVKNFYYSVMFSWNAWNTTLYYHVIDLWRNFQTHWRWKSCIAGAVLMTSTYLGILSSTIMMYWYIVLVILIALVLARTCVLIWRMSGANYHLLYLLERFHRHFCHFLSYGCPKLILCLM